MILLNKLTVTNILFGLLLTMVLLLQLALLTPHRPNRFGVARVIFAAIILNLTTFSLFLNRLVLFNLYPLNRCAPIRLFSDNY